jgi:hypothetical protein
MRSFDIYFDLSIGTGRGGMRHRAVGVIHVLAIMMIAWTIDNRLSSVSAGLF